MTTTHLRQLAALPRLFSWFRGGATSRQEGIGRKEKGEEKREGEERKAEGIGVCMGLFYLGGWLTVAEPSLPERNILTAPKNC